MDINGSIKNCFLENFITLPDERVIVAVRKHWFTLVPPLSISLFLVLIFTFSSFFLYKFFYLNLELFISSVFIIFSLFQIFAVKNIIDWYCHFYILTSHKILEICYAPLCSEEINDVLLDQVKCTEVDVKTDGFINELVDMGDVIMTFDRPTHQLEFVFHNINNPQITAVKLCKALSHPLIPYKTSPLWYRQKNRPGVFRFVEEIFPKLSSK